MTIAGKRTHFVLVHGSCLGAWSWYKVTTMLRAAGHTVTVPDLGGCGRDTRRLDEVGTFAEYVRPLMEVMSAVPPGDKVVLVGHSSSGITVALAAERFPDKLSAVVFLAAFVPDTTSRPSYALEEYVKKFPIPWGDTQHTVLNRGPTRAPANAFLFGQEFAASILYQLSPPEDITLGLSLLRPGALFMEDLYDEPPCSGSKYGSVKKVYIVCGEDLAIPRDFQLWMAEYCGADEVKLLEGADHMPMMSTAESLCMCLEDVAATH